MTHSSIVRLREIDAVAERFEFALRTAGDASIANFLPQVPSTARPDLFRHLLELKVDYIVGNGDVPDRDLLRQQFPEDTATIDEVLEEAGCAPRIIGPYRLLRKIGAGGIGVVYEAIHKSSDERVALKILAGQHSGSTETTARFGREMNAIACMQHSHIVRAVEAGVHDNVQYLAMEFIDGVDAGRLTSAGKALDVANACEIIRQAALGLQHAHDNGLIHRDVKPSNLMIGHDGVVRVLDFGLARNTPGAATETDTITVAGQVMGTIDYLAPEQCRDASKVDERTDIYGLGATLYKLLTGVAPLASERTKSVIEKLTEIALHDFPSVAQRTPDLPSGLAELCDRMLALDSKDRPQTAAELARALAPFTIGHNLANLAIASAAATVDTVAGQQGTAPTVIDPLPAIAVPRRNPFIHFPRVLVAVGAGSLLVLLGVLIRLQTDGGEIVIRCHDPGLQIEVVRNEREVKFFEAGQLADYNWFHSGNYEIRIPRHSRDLLKIENGRFTLKRKSRQIVTIALRPGVDKPESPQVPSEPTKSGLALGVIDRVPTNDVLTPQITEYVNNVSNQTDKEFARWESSRERRIGLALESRQKVLQSWCVAYRQFPDRNATDGHLYFAHQQPFETDDLFVAGIVADQLTADEMRRFKGLPFLKSLTIASAPTNSIQYLQDLPSLQMLSCYATGSGFTDESVQHLMRFPTLHELNLGRTEITDDGVVNLASVAKQHLPRLEHLYLGQWMLTDRGLKAVAAIPTLRTLHYGLSQHVTDEGLASLAGSQINELSLYTTNITDAGVDSLLEMKQLKRLVISRTKITVVGILRLKDLPNLQSIDAREQLTKDELLMVRQQLPHIDIRAY